MEQMILPVMLLLCLHKGLLGDSICGEKKFISGIVGGQVTLIVDKIDFLFIYWVNPDIKLIAKTLSGEPVEIAESEYEGRLKSTADGSLIIMNLTKDDQGQHTANVQRGTLDQCLQRFDLRVFGPLESCPKQNIVSGIEGAEVTLPVNQTDFEYIMWLTVRDLVCFAVTKPKKPVVIQDARYTDCLKATANGSLIITRLRKEDQGVYVTYAATLMWPQKCAQLYNLQVTVREFVGQVHTTTNTIRLGISGCVLLITCCVLIHHLKTKVMGPSHNT